VGQPPPAVQVERSSTSSPRRWQASRPIKSIVASVCTAIAAPLRARLVLRAPGGGKRTNTHDLPTPDRSCFFAREGSHANLRVLPSRKRNPFHRDARSESRCARLPSKHCNFKNSFGDPFMKAAVVPSVNGKWEVKAVGNSQARPQPGRHQDPRPAASATPMFHLTHGLFALPFPRVAGPRTCGEHCRARPTASPPASWGPRWSRLGTKRRWHVRVVFARQEELCQNAISTGIKPAR